MKKVDSSFDMTQKSTQELIAEVSTRLDRIEKLPAHNGDKELITELESKGISRRDFMKWAGAMTAALSLPASFAPLTARAAEIANRTPVIWLHMAEMHRLQREPAAHRRSKRGFCDI